MLLTNFILIYVSGLVLLGKTFLFEWTKMSQIISVFFGFRLVGRLFNRLNTTVYRTEHTNDTGVGN